MVGIPILLLGAITWGALGAGLAVYLTYSVDLPRIPDLRSYRPKTVSNFFAEDGTVIGVFYKEKRFPIPLSSMPRHVVNAFLAAEDARFFSHTGVDLPGVFRALVRNIELGNFSQGGSTITQQVTRNFLLTKEKKISRKIREAILAHRIEKTLTKDEILGLYLNEIYLGGGAYGIEAAAGTHFGKTAAELTIAEAAMLAGSVSNPSRFDPKRNLEGALKRREFVLGRMLHNGFIADQEYQEAMAETPRFRESLPNPFERVPYFTEAVRQYIAAKYGEHRLYNEGLQVWTTCDLPLQQRASEALLRGALAWEKRQGRPAGLVRRLKNTEVKEFLKSPDKDSYNLGDVVQAVVIANNEPKKGKKKTEANIQDCILALAGDARLRMQLESPVRYRPNDMVELLVTKVEGDTISLEHRTLPPAGGALVCIENNTGYVRALVGGLDFERSNFNRATQAMRQPGSAFKPFVYAAGLEWAQYSPQTLIIDEPIAVEIDPREPEWIPMNSDGAFVGPIPFRDALAHSRNVVAVKLLMDVGMDATIQMARTMGIRSPLGRNLSLALGASEVTPLELTSAYTVFPNMGVRVQSVLVKKVVDRFGKVLEDNTMQPLDIAAVANAPEARPAASYSERPGAVSESHEPISRGKTGLVEEMRSLGDEDRKSGAMTGIDSLLSGSQTPKLSLSRSAPHKVLSPQSAYLMLSILRQVCVSGTAASVSRLRRADLAGKTGTTDECTDAWFIGFNPKYCTGVWIGHDAKVSLGRREYGGTAALPVWMDFMKGALADEPQGAYPPPPGIVFSRGLSPSSRGRVNALLEAEPDLLARPDLKEVSPVDTRAVTASASSHAGFVQPMHLGFGTAVYPGMIRVLSPTGQTIGHAFYPPDQKGKLVVYKENYTTGEHEDDSEEQDNPPEWFVSRAARFLRDLRKFVPSISQEGWFR
ncbi:MAG: PBP1A family penicillin-binding protein [Desulfomonile tiedjei]|nr:PBP1A family penicillin-binding protein [Desulfomonile tiedjei]